MSTRAARLLAGGIVMVSLLAAVAWAALLLANRHAGTSGDQFAYPSIPLNFMPLVGFVTVGYLVATRRPRNPIGWLMLALGLGSVPALVEQYGAYALMSDPGALPAGRAAAVAVNGAWVPSVLAIVLITFLFPTGRLPSRRWRFPVVVATASLGAIFTTAHFAVLDPPFEGVQNPIRLHAEWAAPFLIAVIALGVAFGLLAACASVVVRFRRSQGDEREQLKWFVFAAAVIPIGIGVHLVAESFAPGALDTVEALFGVAVTVIPLAIGVAILRYRLYEIDRIVSRTIVYGALTVILGAFYVALVLAGQALFSSFAGGSNLAIAVSTLVVAALFLPLRARVQRIVDRRFNRRRYDAQQTLEAFGARLREETELETLVSDLHGVVVDTMQPAHAALWLRSAS